MTDYIIELSAKYGFGREALDTLLSAFEKIKACKEADFLFMQQLKLYENDILFDYNGSLRNIRTACKKSGVNIETGQLLYVLCLTKHLHSLYRRNQFEEEYFDGVIYDIKSKADECRTVKNIYGTFVAEWFISFYNLSRFAIGRLQFEPYYLEEDICLENITVKKDTLTVATHICSGSRLDIAACIDSFKKAYDVFFKYFENKTVIFYCDSWLLSPDNDILLSENSNIIKFKKLFSVVPSGRSVQHDFWRIFGKEDCSDFDNLPTDNTLRKAYAESAKKGKIPMLGRGVLLMKDREILK